ncbi:MAG: 2-oxo acid dehydrogenase subunit E2 [Chloroflexi bacterium]|nr:2-oxo acid dehydrogenase subunit E2 [Chloroflexota bacterium]
MPKPGQMTEECVLSLWLKAEGDTVTRGDVLFEIETDKSTMEVESFHDGVVLRRLVAEGQTVPVNAICAWIGAPGEAVPDVAEIDAAEAPEVEAVRSPTLSSSAPEAEAVRAASPLSETPTSAGPGTSGRLAISPRASRLAAEAGLDPRSVAGSGPGGRIVERDVAAALAGGRAAAIAAAATSAGIPGAVEMGADEEAPRPLSRMRRVIAERLTLSATTIPSFSVTVAADVTRLMALRDELRERGTSLSVTDFVLAATAQTLAEFPDVNSRTDGRSVWLRRRVHLGLAVALPAGLVVAVIRDADRLGLIELHDRAASLVAAARDGSLPVDDMTGSTFTVSNLGMYGIEAFSAIINPGESAILAVGGAIPTPVALGDGIAVRTVMKLTLTADHRLIDGELGARFAAAIRRRLEDPVGLRRELASS